MLLIVTSSELPAQQLRAAVDQVDTVINQVYAAVLDRERSSR